MLDLSTTRFLRTSHFVERTRTRGVPDDVLTFLITWGVEFNVKGAVHLALIERKLPPGLRACRLVRRAGRLDLVLGDRGALITTYWHPAPVRAIKRKEKRRLSARRLRAQRATS